MKRALLGFTVLFGVVMASACSSEDDPANSDAAATIRVSSNQFSPAQVRVKVGDTVLWTWGGGSHDVVSGTNCTPDAKFRSKLQSSGTFEQKFDTAGTFPFFCTPHCSMGMTGEVIVEP
ncbi:MAG TPA: plastocyanin/azurin family copper-binding protein [Labilithrix sp.]|nr:plastocyanin/azurin family copper-binding protein [Labilithrix sp.]